MPLASFHPPLNATLNGIAACLLVAGFLAIKAGHRERHGKLMVAASLVSAAFLAFYLDYHFRVLSPEQGPTRYHGTGWKKGAYLGMLLTHVVLAAVNLPMILRTLYLAWKQDWERHRRWAKVTFPIWLYVSITGVLVYLVLYHWNPAAPAAG